MLQQMVMTLGATACLHDHLQDLAGSATDLLDGSPKNSSEHADISHLGHSHDEESDSGKHKKKKPGEQHAAHSHHAARNRAKRLSFDDIMAMLKRQNNKKTT